MEKTEALKNEIRAWAATDRDAGVRPSRDGSLPTITAEMLGRRVDGLHLSESDADDLRTELMGIYTEALE